MRPSAILARVIVSGCAVGLAACGTTTVAYENPSSKGTAANGPAVTVATPSEPTPAATAPEAAAPVAAIPAAAPGGEPLFAGNTETRQLVPMTPSPSRERFAETGPVSTDGLTQISFAQEGEDFDPVITPDSKAVIFASTQHRATSDLFIKPVKGSVITQLTNDPADDAMPAISPNGKFIAFASNRSGTWNIYTMPVTGGKPVQITASAAHDLHPSWSPDSSTLVFCRLGEVSRRWELWTVEAFNPSAASFLGYGMLPQWCPKAGTGEGGADRILFQLPRDRGARTFGVWTIDYRNGTTSNPTAIVTSNNSALINPAWSPDGRFIVYAEVPAPTGRVEINQTRPTQSDLWMTAVDGSAKVRLTDGNAVALMPYWQGNRLVFFSDRGGRGNIWTLDTTSAALACSGMAPAVTAQAPAPKAPAHEAATTPAVHAETSGAQVAEVQEPKHD
ncbi:MAG: hypothetical protein U0573_12895 [Phycisphaerales bacterium]|nr:PD40 domain-containing protein [Planctomycetota bacterium]